MADRAYHISLTNYSGNTLTLFSPKFCDGTWTSGEQAPYSIPTGQTVTFGVESDDALRGTEGYVIYTVPDSTTDPNNSEGKPATYLYIYWDNPYIGTTRAGSLVSTSDIDSTFLQGNCSAQLYPASPGTSGYAPPPSVYQVAPASYWAQGNLSYIYPLSSGQGESGEAGGELAASAIPVYGIYEFFGSLFGNAGNMPDAVNAFVFGLQPKYFGNPASMAKFMHDRGLNMSNGLRALIKNPPNQSVISVRKMMELP
jgi:hypothetical protein